MLKYVLFFACILSGISSLYLTESFAAEDGVCKDASLVQANDANEARISEVKERLDVIDTEMAAMEYRALLVKTPAGSDGTLAVVEKWRKDIKAVDARLKAAEAAVLKCNINEAKSELDEADKLLNDAESSIDTVSLIL